MRSSIDSRTARSNGLAIKPEHDGADEFNSFENDRQMGTMGEAELRLYTVVQVATILGVGRSKVYELLYAGELKSVKIGASRRVRYSDLGDYVRYLDDAS